MSVNVNTTTNTIVVQNANQTITVVDNENANIVNVTQPLVNVIEVASPGPQGPVGPTGPQGPSVPFTNIGNDVYATTSSLQVTGSFLVSGSNTFTNIGPAIFSGSTAVSGSLTVNGYDVVTVNQTSSMSVATASYLNTLNQDLTFNGNLTLNGTASISTLVVNETVLSTGSNQLGDNADDTQTLYGSVIVPTGSLVVTGSFTNLLSPTNLQIQSNVSSSFNSPPIYVGGAGWVPLTLSGSISSFLANKTNGYTLNGLVNGSVGIPAFGVNFPIDGIIQVLSTGSDALNSYSQFTDTTALGSAPQLSSGLSSTFFGSDGYNLYRFQLYKNITTNSQSLDVEKINNAGERVSLNLNNGTDGFSIFSTLSQPTSSFLKLVSGSTNLIDFRYEANYIQQNTIIGSTDSPSARLQVKGSGTTNNTLGLNITNNNNTSGLFVQDDGKVGINRIPNNFLNLAWWNLHVSGTIASNQYVVGSKISVNSDVNPVLGGYPMVMNFTSSQAGYANVDFRLESEPNLSFIAPTIGQTPVFTVKYDGKVGIGANNTNPSYLLDVSGSAKINEGIFGIGTSGTILPLVNTAGTGTVVVGGTSPNTPSLRIQGSPLNFFIGSTQVAQMFATTGNFTLQNGGTFTDAGFRLDVSGSARVTGEANVSFLSLSGNTAVNSSGTTLILGASGGWTGVRVPRYFETTGSISAASAIARGTYLNQTLVATANNDVLVGLDIAPTFTIGAFTGVSQIGLRVNGSIQSPIIFGATYLALSSGAYTQPISFYLNQTSTLIARFFGTTGNLLLQNGGTFTDSGARLHISGSTSEALLVASSSAGPALYVSGSGQVGIGTSTPSSSILLDVSGSIRSFNILPAANGSYDIGVSANKFRNGWFAGSLVAPSGYLNNLFFGITNFGIYNSIGTQLAQMFGTGDLVLQNGGTFTNNNYRLQVNATGSNSGSLFLGGTTIATGSIARTMLISSSLSASANNDVLVGLDITPTFAAGAFTGVQQIGLRLINPTSAPAGGWTNSPSIYLQGSIWNSAFGPRTMAGSILMAPATYPSNGNNINPTISKMSFLVGADSSTPTERMFLNSDGKLGVVGGIILNATTTSNTFNLTLDNSATATSGGTTWNSNKLVLKGRAWNSAQGSVNNMAYLMVSNITNNANPTVDKLSFFVGSANSLNAGDTDGNAIERFSLRTDGIATLSGSLNITGSSNSNLLRIDSPASSSILVVSGSGNVGIGTATPTNTIDIVSTTTGSLRISGSAGSQITLVRPTLGLFGYVRYLGTNMDIGTNGNDPLRLSTNNTTRISIGETGFVGIGIGASAPSSLLQVRGSGTTSATTALLVQNSTPTNLLSVLDNGQVSFTSPTMSLAASQSAFSISPIISASNVVGGQYYGVSITPTFFQTTGSQTETAFRVAATFTSSNATAISGSNIIADFGSTSAGSQLTVTDVTSGSIYMVNDVSGIPIIEATSNWDVNIYDFPNKIFEKTGSQVNIYGTMRVSGSFILPLSQSVAPQTGSAYWSGSLLFIYDGTRYRSSSFA